MLLKPRVFSKTIAAAGTKEQLTTSELKVPDVTIQAKSINTGTVYIGDNQVSSSLGIELVAGDSIALQNDDLGSADAKISLRNIWLDVSVNGEGVTVLYLERG